MDQIGFIGLRGLVLGFPKLGLPHYRASRLQRASCHSADFPSTETLQENTKTTLNSDPCLLEPLPRPAGTDHSEVPRRFLPSPPPPRLPRLLQPQPLDSHGGTLISPSWWPYTCEKTHPREPKSRAPPAPRDCPPRSLKSHCKAFAAGAAVVTSRNGPRPTRSRVGSGAVFSVQGLGSRV